MKILYLKLKNYASIYTAMGLKEIEIDFSKSKNNIILFVGDNGSGKTSLLSTLHPFPYYGSMDVRNSTSIIREDKDGYKEIHIQSGDDIYKIQHHYKNSKRGIQLKSFVRKNEEELNPNGNVTSFNEIIKEELSLELDFLRLIRLGSNVTNLIDMKASERKSFTSYLLSDINLYTNLFKKINEDNRILKNMIRSVSDKLIKLNVLDESVLKTEIENLENKLNELNSDKDKLQHKLGITEGKISSLVPEGIDALIKDISGLEYLISTEQDNISAIKSIMNKLYLVIIDSIDVEIENILKDISVKENEKDVNTNMALFYKEQLSTLYNKKTELENVLKTTVSDNTYKDMVELYSDIISKIKVYDDKFKNYDPIYTKDNLLTLLEVLRQIDNIANETYGYDKRAISKVIELIRGSTNVSSYITNKTKEIDNEILKITTDLKSSINPNNPIILFKPDNCPEKNCPYLFLYDKIFGKEESDNGKGLSSLNNEKALLENMSYVNSNIDYIFMILKTNMTLISKGNISYFKVDSILDSLLSGSSIYDENFITDLISEVEEYEEYLAMISKSKELKTELNLLKSNSSIIETTRKELSSIDSDIIDITGKIAELENANLRIENLLSKMNFKYENLLKYSEYLSQIDKSNEAIKTFKLSRDIKLETLEKVSDLNESSLDLKKKIDLINWEINKFNTEIFNLKVKLKDFISLNEEREILNEKFDDVNIIRESLSSNKGIPLLYMQLYLKNTKLFVNELLKIVYADNFEIDDFDINESEFNIPYIKNNIRISDVVYASQGEKSFLSLALSFALINQSIKDYNILLLDEIDATLDTKNRAMFLNILEKQMESIGSEQIFLITHNNMFENYPVDIILTSPNKVSNFNNANILYSV